MICRKVSRGATIVVWSALCGHIQNGSLICSNVVPWACKSGDLRIRSKYSCHYQESCSFSADFFSDPFPRAPQAPREGALRGPWCARRRPPARRLHSPIWPQQHFEAVGIPENACIIPCRRCSRQVTCIEARFNDYLRSWYHWCRFTTLFYPKSAIRGPWLKRGGGALFTTMALSDAFSPNQLHQMIKTI